MQKKTWSTEARIPKSVPKLSKMSKTCSKSAWGLKATRNSMSKGNEAAVLGSIFPAEIWTNMFKLSDAEIQRNVYRASPYLAQVSRPFRTNFLFAPVLKCVMHKISDNSLTDKVLIRCREVSRSWCSAVDEILQDQKQHSDVSIEASNLENFPKYLNSFHVGQFYLQRQLRNFENHFQETHLCHNKNTYMTRYLKISHKSFDNHPNGQLYFSVVEDQLINSGKHIWFGYITGFIIDCNNQFNFHRLVNLMPNLKVLTVHMTCVTLAKQHKQFPAITQEFLHYPNLQCLRFYGQADEFNFEKVLCKNRHIKSLVLVTSNYLYDKEMINLEKLKVDFKCTRDFQRMDEEKVNWPLKTLIVNLASIERAVKWGELISWFQILERKFGNTLEYLEIIFPDVYDVDNLGVLNLPKITSLTLDLPFCVPLDFILPTIKSLRVLNIRLCRTTVVEEEVVKFFSVCGNLHNSNIWHLLPKLREVTYYHKFWHDKPENYKKSGFNFMCPVKKEF